MEPVNEMSCNGGCAGRREVMTPGAREIDRRTFIARSAIFAAAAALAACASTNATSPDLTTAVGVKVSDYPALANVGGVALVSAGGASLAIVRTGTSTFEALSRVCPHQGGIVNPANGGFQCPVHGARFDINGDWIGGQQTSSLRSYTTSYDATTGTLTIG